MNEGLFIILVFMYISLVAMLVWFRKDIRKHPGARFVFGITDLWAFSIGLSPLLAVLSYMIKIKEPAALLVALVGIPYGLAGAYMVIVKNSVANFSRLPLFLRTVGGTFLGTYLLPFAVLMAWMFVAFLLGVLVVGFPWSLIIPLAVVVLGKIARKYSNAPPVDMKPASDVADTSNDRSRDA